MTDKLTLVNKYLFTALLILSLGFQAWTSYNAEKNKVQDRISYYLPEQFSPMTAEIVVANILAKPLIELSASIAALVKPGGQLILSGILNEQAESVAEAYRGKGLAVAEAISQEDWCRLDAENVV